MIEALACLWPEHAYWLVTGDELPKEGMTNPTKQHSREIQTLKEFTAQTLATRIAIRNELFGTAFLNAVDDEPGEADEKLVGEFVEKFLNNLETTNIDLHSLSKEDRTKVVLEAFEAKLAHAMKDDEQLSALEQTRDRLLIQVLVKASSESKTKTIVK